MPESDRVFHILNLGCPKNEVDSDSLASALIQAGWREADDPRNAAVMVVNTCSFIVPAVEESLETVLELADLREDRTRFLVVAGCLVSRYGKASLEPLLPEVDLLVDFDDYPHFVSLLDALVGVSETHGGGIAARKHAATLSKGYVYLKISEGCDRRCSFCTIPSIRGPLCSRSPEQIREEAQFFIARGIGEIILIAQDTTSYGLDIHGMPSLAGLLRDLCDIGGDWRLRVMYMHPEGIDAHLLEAMSDPRVCRYLDLPFQHVNAGILRAMGRKGDAVSHRKLLRLVEEIVGEVALRATLMTGFPGEDEESFASLRDFVAETRFDWLGLFSYSHEEGTPAFFRGKRTPAAVAHARLEELAAIQDEIMRDKASAMQGRKMRVLVEGESEEAPGFWEARSQRESPEIDGVIFVYQEQGILPGTLRDVRIIASEGIDLIGVIQD